MKIALSGGEKGTFRNILTSMNVPCIALNVSQFTVPKTKELNLRELLNGAEVVVYSSDGDENVSAFDDFIRTNADDISLVIGRPDYNGTWLGDKYVPIWNDPNDLERLAYLCEKHGRVAISDRAINSKSISRIKQLQQRWGTYLVGLTSKVDVIEAINWDLVVVSSWTSTVRFGETQVWDGHGLKRYAAQKKESARTRHRADIVRLGIDYEALMEGDVKEAARLAVKSWMAWGEASYGSSFAAYHPGGADDEEEFEDPEMGQVATTSPEMAIEPYRDSDTVAIATKEVRRRHDNERQLLPVIGMEKVTPTTAPNPENPDEYYEIDPDPESVIRFNGSGIRQCDSCYLATRCPRFEAHAECAYDLPVQVRTKAQLQALISAIIEMQATRVMFAKFAEDLEGQGIDASLSQEMDRLLRLIKESKDIQDTRDLVRFEVEAKASAGVLSRIFGKDMERPQLVSQTMESAEIDKAILDAEVLD